MSTESDLGVATAGDPSNPALVLVHGAMDRSAGMLRLSRRLDRDFFVVRYDRRGYGRSIDIGPPYTIAAHIADLVDVIERFVPSGRARGVFGHSLGGNVALGVAHRRAELIERVAVFETPLSWLGWWPGNTAGASVNEHGDPADAAEMFMRRIVGDEVWERLPASTRSARRAEGHAMVGEVTDLGSAAPWQASCIEHPVLVGCGEFARPHHRRGALYFADVLHNATPLVLEGAGHGAPLTHAEQLSEKLRLFLS